MGSKGRVDGPKCHVDGPKGHVDGPKGRVGGCLSWWFGAKPNQEDVCKICSELKLFAQVKTE